MEIKLIELKPDMRVMKKSPIFNDEVNRAGTVVGFMKSKPDLTGMSYILVDIKWDGIEAVSKGHLLETLRKI